LLLTHAAETKIAEVHLEEFGWCCWGTVVLACLWMCTERRKKTEVRG